jgi:hypothetical protein
MDFCWSFGVLCHHSQSQIAEVLRQTLSKMKPGAYAAHQYGDWDKLETFGWERGWIPLNFKNLPDDEIWWPRNSSSAMNRVAQAAGWNVVTPDLNLLGRDSIIVLQCPPKR